MERRVSLKVNKTRSIEGIFQKVKDYDLVLTIDAPLADALNARLERPKLGYFATTPRRLALDGMKGDKIFRDKRELFLKIIKDTDLNRKRATYLLEEIVECWKETGDPTNIFKQKTTHEEDIKTILKVLEKTINPFTAVERYDIDDKKDVAIISRYQFNALDKKILPEEYDEIEVFTEEKKELPSFHIFNSTTEIVETVLDNIRDIEPRSAAVVMDENSQYRYLIEALFRSNDIPYMISKDLSELEEMRKMLNLIRASFFREGLKVKDVKSLFSRLTSIDPKTEEYLLDSYEEDDIYQVREVLDKIPDMTFEELLNKDIFQKDMEEISRHLNEVNILEKQITLERFNFLLHYMDSFDIKVESAGQGVLIASPNSSSFIDRPYVFYLGMGTSWTPDTPASSWTDKERFHDKNKKDFEVLIQNGKEQYYLVKNKEMGEKVVPSFYLNEFCDEYFESFKDIKHELNEKELKGPDSLFTKEDIETDLEPVKTMSQSTLNSLTRCPKDQFFSELVETPDKAYFKRGTIFHDFAEFFLNHPKVCKDLDHLVERVIDEMKPFLEEHEIAGMKTKFKVGMKNLRSFLKEQDIRFEDIEGYEKTRTNNLFSEMFNRSISSNYTEVSFNNEEIGAKGKVDLILDEDHLVDHKSGSKNSIYSIMRKSDIEKIDERPDFQAKMYLAHHRRYYDGDPIRFTYYHLLDNLSEVISGEGDFRENEVTIEYYPIGFNDMTQKKEIYEWLKSSNKRRKVLEKLEYKNYKTFFDKKEITETDKKSILESDVTADFKAHCKEKIGSYKYVEKGCEGIMKKLMKFRNTHYFKKDLDRFEDFLDGKIEEYERYRTSNFPVGEADLDNIENKDLVIPERVR
ncbi:MAG: PD-(D/E)XK nuclease family protein [Candidatus Thermoplasmatota archaeon]|nr:PD-(D/E)XK nuclease family protein [Candidatus Thermoplasmatota archaeon]